MTAETIRLINASLFAVLVFMWTLWLFMRIATVWSRLIAGLTAVMWCLLSVTAYDAASNNGPLASHLTYLFPFVLVPLNAALIYDVAFRPPRPDWSALLRRIVPWPFDESNHPRNKP